MSRTGSHIRNITNMSVIVFLCSTGFLGRTVLAAESVRKHYVVIVANNVSLDDGVEPLQFADDDGARYFELFSAAGSEVRLLAVLDKDAQTKFPNAAKSAILPNKANLYETLSAVFSSIREDNADGATTHFTFVYAGHGNVGPNREGYINLLDERFYRRNLFHDVIGASPATFNHIILDACYAYYMVNKRGGRAHRIGNFQTDMLDFLKSEHLASYPNTGVILAASQDSETHEWRRLESGIFSHELLSALLGAGDVNEDGQITYQEAAACVEAANAAIPIPKARLNVYFHPPTNRDDVPIVSLSSFIGVATLRLDSTMSGRYYVEDARGVRIADLHFSKEQGLALMLVGKAPFYLRDDEREAVVEGTSTIEGRTLIFNHLSEQRRGSVEQSFRKHLFEFPFGIGFFRGMQVAFSGKEAETERDARLSPKEPVIVPKSFDLDKSKVPLRSMATLGIGYGLVGASVASGIASGVLYGVAQISHRDYKNAETVSAMQDSRKESERRMRYSRLFMGTGVGLGIAGATLVIVELLKPKPKGQTVDTDRGASVSIRGSFGALGIHGDF